MAENRITLSLDGGSVSALEWKPRAAGEGARTVLLLHGGGVDNASLSWGEIGPQLADQGYRVIAPDHPGFGRSPRASWPMTQEALIAYVGEIVDELGLDRYAVGGLSLGGGMTIGHVHARPDRVAGLMLLGSYGLMPRLSDGPFSRLGHSLTWLLLRTGLLGWLTRSYARSPARMEKGLAELVRNPGQRTPELINAVMHATERSDSYEVFEQWQRDQIGWSELRTDYSERLHDIACPALIVHGSRDSGVPIERARRAAQALPRAELIEVPGAGHWVQRDAPHLVLPAMTRFLSDLEW